MWLTWLAGACRETGYPVVELPGWQTRGHGQMLGAHGVVGHWTAGPPDSVTVSNAPSLRVVRDGRPDLPGPLAHVLTGFDGTLYVVAAGLCYHAGASAWRGETDLNNTFVGNEVESPGGFVYTAAQRDVTPRLHAALLRRMGRSAAWSAAHFEVALPAGRKSDGPARDMTAFRRIVAGYLARPATIHQEDDLPADPKVLAALDRISDRLDALYRSGFASVAADGKPDPTHEAVSVRGVNAELNRLSAAVSETNRLLGLLLAAQPPVLQRVPQPSPGTEPLPEPLAEASPPLDGL